MKILPNKQRKLINYPFVEKTERSRNKKGKKNSGGMVETWSQKASEEEKAMLEREIHPNHYWNEIRRDVKRKKMGLTVISPL